MMSAIKIAMAGLLLFAFLAAPAASLGANDLASLATVVDRTSHRASSFDRTGGNNDNIMSIEPGRTLVLLDTDGPGLITHVWMTVAAFHGHQAILRDLVLRIYWEGSNVPSVETPLGEFFGLGHGRVYPVKSLPINVGADPKALNCYWPMPFYKHARVEVTNVGNRSIRRVFYNIDYELGPISPQQGLFHAEFRSARDLQPQVLVANTKGEDNYVILDAQGEGQYAGCFLFVDSAPGGWWGEGDEMVFIDGETKPSIVGTGTEDYFCEAWGFDRVTGFPFYGLPLLDKLADGWLQTTVYRFHVPDPVRFKKSIRVTIEHGWKGNVANDYSSIAYWYQLEPAASRPPLPRGDDYRLRSHAADSVKLPSDFRWCATRTEADLRQAGVAARGITTSLQKSWGGGFLQVDTIDRPVSISIPVPGAGRYRVRARLIPLDGGRPVTLSVPGEPTKRVDQIGEQGVIVELGTTGVGEDQSLVVTAQSSAPFAIDYFAVNRVPKPNRDR